MSASHYVKGVHITKKKRCALDFILGQFRNISSRGIFHRGAYFRRYFWIGLLHQTLFIWRKVVPGIRVCMSQLSYIYLQYMANCSLQKRKDSASRVTLLAGPTLHPYKHFASRSRVNFVRARQSEHPPTLLAQASRSPFFPYKHLLKLTQLGE